MTISLPKPVFHYRREVKIDDLYASYTGIKLLLSQKLKKHGVVNGPFWIFRRAVHCATVLIDRFGLRTVLLNHPPWLNWSLILFCKKHFTTLITLPAYIRELARVLTLVANVALKVSKFVLGQTTNLSNVCTIINYRCVISLSILDSWISILCLQ